MVTSWVAPSAGRSLGRFPRTGSWSGASPPAAAAAGRRFSAEGAAAAGSGPSSSPLRASLGKGGRNPENNRLQ